MSQPYRPKVLGADKASLEKRTRFRLGPQSDSENGKKKASVEETDKDYSLRTCCIRSGAVSKASGSAYAEFGNTKVICSVFGPHAKRFGRPTPGFSSDSGALNCEVRYAPFAYKASDKINPDNYPNQGGGDGLTSHEYRLSASLEQAVSASIQLDRFPKSVLDINVYVLEDDGCALAASITCVSLALIDAGIELYDIVAGCTVADYQGRLIVDPSHSELAIANGVLIMSLMPNHGKVTQFDVKGNFSVDRLGKASSLGFEGCSTIARMIRDEAINTARKKASDE